MQTKDTLITFQTYKKPTIQVPNVVGQTYADAADALSAKGLKPVRTDVNSDKPAGQVVAEDPKAYTNVAPGEQITLSVSNGKSGVPNEIGKQVSNAKADLNGNGWPNVTTQPRQTSDRAQDGIVLDQTPVTGSYPKSQQITLVYGVYVPPTPTPTTPKTTPTTPTTTPTTPTTTPTTPTPPQTSGFSTLPPGFAPPTGPTC
jgi:serine/threonine-protein kinase